MYHLELTEVLTVVVSFGVGRETVVEEIVEGINNTKSFLIKKIIWKTSTEETSWNIFVYINKKSSNEVSLCLS